MPAIAAAGALDQVVLAIAGLLVILAVSVLFRPFITGVIAQLPVVGGWAAARADLLMAQLAGDAVGLAQQALGPAGDVFQRLWAIHSVLGDGVLHAIQNTYNALWRVKYQVVPNAVGQAMDLARQLAQQAEQYALQLVQQEARAAQQEIAQVAAYAQALAEQDQQYARALASQVAAVAEAGDQATQQYARQLAQAAMTTAEAGDQVLEQYAAQLAAQGIAYTQAAVQDLERTIAGVGAQSDGYAQQLEQQALGYAQQVGAAVAAAAAAGLAAVEARVTDIEDSPCQQSCSPLGDIGSLLQGLEDAGIQALLLAVIGEVESDPAAVQQVLRDDFAPIFKNALGALV